MQEHALPRFGLAPGAVPGGASGPLAALAGVRLVVDEHVARLVRDHAPPEVLQAILAPLQLTTEQFLAAGGKRVRSALLLSAYEAWAPPAGSAEARALDERALDAAAAIEILHGFMLAHDDIVDRSAQRRGQPTLHVRLASLCAGRRDAPLGADLALIAGDLLFAHANRVMMLADWPADRRTAILRDWCAMSLDTGFGQWADTLNDASATVQLTARQILDIARAKTAFYTFAGPLVMGARIAGAPPEVLDALHRYGAALGTAYQVRDDLIDLFDGRSLGKDAADDLRRGRLSVPLAIAVERCGGADRERLRALCSGDDGGSVSARRAWVLQLVHRAEAGEAARQIVLDEVATAEAALRGIDKPQAQLWRGLAKMIVDEVSRLNLHRALAPAIAQAASA